MIWNLKQKDESIISQFMDGIIYYHRSGFVCKRSRLCWLCRWKGFFDFYVTRPNRTTLSTVALRGKVTRFKRRADVDDDYGFRNSATLGHATALLWHGRRMHFSCSEYGKWLAARAGEIERAGAPLTTELSKRQSFLFSWLNPTHITLENSSSTPYHCASANIVQDHIVPQQSQNAGKGRGFNKPNSVQLLSTEAFEILRTFRSPPCSMSN